MLKRFIGHPLKLALFFLCIAGTLPAQNDSKPVQNDSRVMQQFPMQNNSRTWVVPNNCCPIPNNCCPIPNDCCPVGNDCCPIQNDCCPIPSDCWNGGNDCCPPFAAYDQGCCFDNNCCFDNCGCGTFYAGFEGLYWRVNEDNLSFANREHYNERIVYSEPAPNGGTHESSKSSAEIAAVEDLGANLKAPPPPPPGGATIYSKGKIKKQDFDFKWRPGFRLTAAYLFPCNCWDLGFRWTHFLNSASKHVGTSGVLLPPYGMETSSYTEDQIWPTYFPDKVVQNRYVNHANAHWHVNFNNYEIAFGRHICVGCGFGIRPYIGVKILDIEQRLHINHERNQNYLYPSQDYGDSEQRFKTRFCGVGFQGGFDASWLLGCGFTFCSNVSGGIVYGRTHIRERFDADYTYPYAPEATYENLNHKFRHTIHVSRPNLDLGLGVRWQTCLCNCYYLGVKVGWEYHHYFDQNFFRFAHNSDPGRGDLAMHGVTFGADLSF